MAPRERARSSDCRIMLKVVINGRSCTASAQSNEGRRAVSHPPEPPRSSHNRQDRLGMTILLHGGSWLSLQGLPEGTKRCEKCKCFKPPRAAHCSECKRSTSHLECVKESKGSVLLDKLFEIIFAFLVEKLS